MKFKKIRDEKITAINHMIQNIILIDNEVSSSIKENSKSPRDILKVVKKFPQKYPILVYSYDLFFPITLSIIEKNNIRIEKKTKIILKS